MSCKHTPITNWNSELRGDQLVYLADTPCKMKQGLQGVRYMPPATLVLFPHILPGTYMHTMNCHLPMDIIFLDKDGKVLSKTTATPNKKKVGPAPKGTAKVLEAPAGWCKHRCVTRGDDLRIYSSANLGW